ncbi:MAG: hypothetical protein OXC56_04635 [Chloroflexi bacterium]|nr:hypothetical protein [Chloroflexota bacterium]
MAAVNVRRLDDEVVRRLKARAAANNRSLEAELRQILESVVAEDDYLARKRAFAEYSNELRALTGGRDQTPSEELIRASRDSGYGRTT